MINPNKIILENLEVVKEYLTLKNFATINIIGNRILQDLYSINEKEMMVIGLIIKEISMDLQLIHAQPKGKLTSHQKKEKEQKIHASDDVIKAIPIATTCIEAIEKNLESKFSSYDCWIAYIDYEDKIRKYLVAPDERDKYGDNHEFSTKATITYLNFLVSNKELLSKKSKFPLERTRSELALLTNLHGGRIPIISYLFIRAFEHTTRFAIFGKIDDNEFASFIDLNLHDIAKIIEFINKSDEKAIIESANQMIGELMFAYRDYFGKYGDLKGELSEEMPLSPDIAERIQKVIEKHQG